MVGRGKRSLLVGDNRDRRVDEQFLRGRFAQDQFANPVKIRLRAEEIRIDEVVRSVGLGFERGERLLQSVIRDCDGRSAGGGIGRIQGRFDVADSSAQVLLALIKNRRGEGFERRCQLVAGDACPLATGECSGGVVLRVPPRLRGSHHPNECSACWRRQILADGCEPDATIFEVQREAGESPVGYAQIRSSDGIQARERNRQRRSVGIESLGKRLRRLVPDFGKFVVPALEPHLDPRGRIVEIVPECHQQSHS